MRRNGVSARVLVRTQSSSTIFGLRTAGAIPQKVRDFCLFFENRTSPQLLVVWVLSSPDGSFRLARRCGAISDSSVFAPWRSWRGAIRRRCTRSSARSTSQAQDVCCLDVFRAAVAQAKNPNLPIEQRLWWQWSRDSFTCSKRTGSASKYVAKNQHGGAICDT
jgi:hypothetical protein